jgi:multisubunit Na+/H+ antiporter MnhB subunit
MVRRERMSLRTRVNWMLDFVVFLVGILAAISGVYFLTNPSGGFQGGRNPAYGLRGFIERETWDDLHTWGGILMVIAALVHFIYHWSWVVMMARRMVSGLRARGSRMSLGAKVNVTVDALLAISFLVTAISGVVFLFAPGGGFQGGTNPAWDFTFLWSRTTWDLIHTWSGVVMIIAAVLHFAIHWRWVLKVTRRFFRSLVPQFGQEPRTEANAV